MINKNELRLGNYFNTFLNDVFQVDELKSKFVMGKSDNGFCNTTYEEIEPIPLTPGVLEKVGFIKMGGVWTKENFEWYSDLCFTIEYDSTVTGSYSVDISHIKHLHQFQNLYQSLTGQELEIKQKTA